MASTKKSDVIQVKLNVSKLSPSGRVELAEVIAGAAPQSALYKVDPAMKAAVDTVVQCGEALDAALKEELAAEQKVVVAKAAVAAAQARLDKELACLKSTAEAKCKSEKDLNDLGLSRRASKASPMPLSTPVEVSAKPGKERGSVVARVKKVGTVSVYAAEICADPVGASAWQSVPGTGTRRSIGGLQSGASYWVRFRALRANDQSDWSDAVPVVAR